MKDAEFRSPDYRWVILAVTVLAQTASGGTTQGVPALAVFFQADLHLSRTEIGLLNSASGFGLMISLIAAGWAADRVGSRLLMLVGLLSMGFSLATVALGRSFLQIALLLFVAGITTGVTAPAISRAVVIWFRPRDRGLAMGVQRTGIPLMGALSAAILPSVALAHGWRAAILVLAAVMVVAALIVFAIYRDTPEGSPGSRPLTAPPGSPWKLLRNRNILLASLLPSVLVAAQFCLVNYLVLYFTDTLAAPIVVAGAGLAVVQMGGIGGRIFWGLVSDRLFRGGRRDVMLLIGVLSCLLLVIMGFLPAGVPLWTVTILGATLGVLVLGWHAVHTIFMPELAGKELAGSAVGLGFTIMQVGSVVGPPVFGYIVDVTGDYRWGWRALGLIVALGTVLLLPVKEARKK